MQNKTTTGAPFQKIQDACATTGLSRYFLRNGCKDGSIPHIKSGEVYYINIPALLSTSLDRIYHEEEVIETLSRMVREIMGRRMATGWTGPRGTF